jgi:hypothetical protein
VRMTVAKSGRVGRWLVNAPAVRRVMRTEPTTSSAMTPPGAAARTHVIVIERRVRSENAAEDPTDAMGVRVHDGA